MSRLDDDPRLDEARGLALPDVADALGLEGLRRAGQELVGPCPDCGGDDRFAISIPKNVWNCRRCNKGGDAIALVQLARGCDFGAALDHLCGAREAQLDPAEAARRRKLSADQKQRREAEAARHRRESIAAAERIWRETLPAEDTPVRAYLERRGIRRAILREMPRALRFHPGLPYMAPDGPGRWREVHRGPAMVAAIRGPGESGGLIGIHRTWLDLGQPRGKAVIREDGRILESKKVLGSQKGGHIRLTDRALIPVIVMGEGIETTLTARIAGDARCAYWAGISLGNMAGRAKPGKGMRFAGIPDLDDLDAFLPHPACRRLVFIQDGDSEPKMTRAKLLTGLRRAMARRPGLTAAIVHAGEGRDLNDIVMEVPADV